MERAGARHLPAVTVDGARARATRGGALLVLHTADDPREPIPPYSERPDEIRLNSARALAAREGRG